MGAVVCTRNTDRAEALRLVHKFGWRLVTDGGDRCVVVADSAAYKRSKVSTDG